MENFERFGVMLDEKNANKIKDFSFYNSVTQSELVRVLVENAKLEINVKSAGELIKEGWAGNRKRTRKVFLITKEVRDKLIKLKGKNRASYAEIMRQLIENADFNKLKFNTISETLIKARWKDKKK